MSRPVRFRALQVLDAVVGGAAIALALAVAVAVPVLAGGGTLLQVREGLFLVGLGLLVVATVLTRPERGREAVARDEEGAHGGTNERADDREAPPATPLQRRVARLVPGQRPLGPDEQLSTGARLLVAGGLLELLAVGWQYAVGPW